MSRVPRILVVTLFDGSWTWLKHHFKADEYEWHFLKGDLLGKGRRGAAYQAWRAWVQSGRYDLVITHGPWLTLFLAALMRTFSSSTPHLAFTFNHGNGRFFSGGFLWLAKHSLATVELFVTHSNHERQLLSEKYGIPTEKILFSYWGVQDPDWSAGRPDYLDEGEVFVACIGRNNRDLGSFLEAMSGLPWKAVLICRAGQTDGLDVPDNVVVRTDVPLLECDQVLDRASVSVIPLLDESTGAGHMTIVSGMLRGIPHVVTRCKGIDDYFKDGEHGLLCDQRSPAALATAIGRIMSDHGLRESMAKKCRTFAVQNFTETSSAQFLRGILQRHFIQYPVSKQIR